MVGINRWTLFIYCDLHNTQRISYSNYNPVGTFYGTHKKGYGDLGSKNGIGERIKRDRFHTMIEKLEFLEKQCEPLENEIRKLANNNEDVKILMTIPELDYFLASLLTSYIGDFDRFEDDDKLTTFFGIVPTMKDSSDVKRRGRMSKEGSSVARWALSVAVDSVIRFDETLDEYYQSVKKRTGSGKLAHVSTMRNFVSMIYYILINKKH